MGEKSREFLASLLSTRIVLAGASAFAPLCAEPTFGSRCV